MLDLPIENRIGVSTHFMPSVHGEDIFRAIELAHTAGFAGFEIVPSEDQGSMGFPYNVREVGLDLLGASSSTVARLKDCLRVFDWVTVHGPHLDWNLSSANRHLRQITWDYYDRCFDFAVEVGAAATTFHGGTGTLGFIRSPDEASRYSCDYARHLIQRAEQAGMPVGFEAGTLDFLRYVCDRVEGWGINLDIGHAYIDGDGSDQGFFAYMDELGSRVVEVHHNGVCHLWFGFMEHLPIHLNNAIDYQGTYERLKALDYRGPIIWEIMGPDIDEALRHCQEAKEMICGIWNGTTRLRERWSVGER